MKPEPLTFQRKPEEFSARVSSYLETMQHAYGEEISEPELVLWRETLRDGVSFQELDAAFKVLIKHPPKYTGPDGSLQVWRKMPRLPDVMQTIWELREQATANNKALGEEVKQEEWKRLARRRAEHPEEFITSFTDLLREVMEKRPNFSVSQDRNGAKVPGKIMAAIEVELTGAQLADRMEMLKQQAAMLKEKYGIKP